MPRPLRFIPENAFVEITTRTLQGKLAPADEGQPIAVIGDAG